MTAFFKNTDYRDSFQYKDQALSDDGDNIQTSVEKKKAFKKKKTSVACLLVCWYTVGFL